MLIITLEVNMKVLTKTTLVPCITIAKKVAGNTARTCNKQEATVHVMLFDRKGNTFNYYFLTV